jgi:hypothetical protein
MARLAAGIFAFGLSVGVAPTAEASGTATPDFTVSLNYESPSFTGELIRGGLASCPDCTTTVEPRYLVPDPLGCFHGSNTLSVVSLNGFGGTVNIRVLGLPAGVTSLTAASLTLPQGGGAASTPLSLQAASASALGTTTITILATSGVLSHTDSHTVVVEDQLSQCPPTMFFFPNPVTGGGASQGTVTLSGTAPAATTVALSSSNPAVATVPTSVTVAAGASSAVFPISTVPVSATTRVFITASVNGASDTEFLDVSPPQSANTAP